MSGRPARNTARITKPGPSKRCCIPRRGLCRPAALCPRSSDVWALYTGILWSQGILCHFGVLEYWITRILGGFGLWKIGILSFPVFQYSIIPVFLLNSLPPTSLLVIRYPFGFPPHSCQPMSLHWHSSRRNSRKDTGLLWIPKRSNLPFGWPKTCMETECIGRECL